MVVRGVVLSPTTASVQPQRTCVGCRKVDVQSALVRLAFDDKRLVVDRLRRLPGRGVYMHPRAACVTAAGRAGFARSLRREVAGDDIKRIASEMSPTDDNSHAIADVHTAGETDRLPEKAAGLAAVKTVETPLIKAKDDRSEDARL